VTGVDDDIDTRLRAALREALKARILREVLES